MEKLTPFLRLHLISCHNSSFEEPPCESCPSSSKCPLMSRAEVNFSDFYYQKSFFVPLNMFYSTFSFLEELKHFDYIKNEYDNTLLS